MIIMDKRFSKQIKYNSYLYRHRDRLEQEELNGDGAGSTEIPNDHLRVYL